MKVIFIKDHKSGKVSEIKSVSDGFAKNFLLPKKFAIQATEENIENLKVKLEKEKEVENIRLSKLTKEKEDIENSIVVINRTRTPKGLLQGKITKAQLAEEFYLQTSIKIDPKKLDFKTGNTFGTFKVPLSLGSGFIAEFTLFVREND